MTAMIAERNVPRRSAEDFSFPVDAGARIYTGAIVAMKSTGYATQGATATGLRAVGIAQATADNTGGAAGAEFVEVRRGCYLVKNSAAADQITLADVGAACYLVDDQTVAKTDGTGTRSPAGIVRDVADSGGVWVEF